MPRLPLVSIIVPNYNGKHFLENCFKSISKLNFPKGMYEVILVDNNSKDNSVDFIRNNYPRIKIITNEINLGFAKGCNVGANYAKGKYIAFLNTDTEVTEDWLSYLVKRIESDTMIAAVNSKILLYFPFIELAIQSDVYMRSEFTDSADFQQLGVLVENVLLENQPLQPLIRYRTGFCRKENGDIITRWTNGDATILVPCDSRKEKVKMILTIRSGKSNSALKTHILIKLGEQLLVEDNLKSYEVKQYPISLNMLEIKRYFQYTVQNSGLVVFKNGFARDRGAVVKDHEQFYEIDNPFYGKEADIHAFCGASFLIRKDIFNKMGGFDESFFLYYEDVDLSLRLKRMGWKIIYEPKSIVYHVHAGSSVEGSLLFLYNTEKNRLAVILKQFPIRVFLEELLMYVVLYGATFLRMIKFRLKENWGYYDLWKDKTECRINVIKWILCNLKVLYHKRKLIDKTEKKTLKSIFQTFY